MKWSIIRKILITALIALVVIQFISIDKANPKVNEMEDFISNTRPPAKVADMIRNACYDCHSHETTYPWYTNVQPVAWWIKGHIKEGKKHLNYSEWASYSEDKQTHKIEESIEEIESNHMPLKSYTWTHSKAKLSHRDREEMIQWLKSL